MTLPLTHPAWALVAVAFLLAWGLLIGLWLGYPLLMAVCGAVRRYRPRQPRTRARWPTVSVIVAAHNEAATIAARIENLWEQRYPAERVEILISEDGSVDGTAEAVRRLAERGGRYPLRLLTSPERMGKAGAMNRAARAADGEVLVFTDANNAFCRDALRHLAAPFADPAVGAVVGRKTVARNSGVGGGESVYWRYEGWLLRQETRAGSVAGACGEVLAVRRGAFVPLPEPGGLANDDVFLLLQVLLQRRRVVAAPGARSIEAAAANEAAEWERRRRMAAGRWAALAALRGHWRELGWARAAQVFCHQVLRPISALWMAVALLAGAALLRLPPVAWGGAGAWWRAMAELQAAGALAWLGVGVARRLGYRLGRLEAPYFFVLALGASLQGGWRYWRGSQPALWHKPPRGAGAVFRLRAGVGSTASAHPPAVTHGNILGGLFWAASSFAAGKLLVFGSVIVLARLLAPRAFGEVALATSALLVLEIFGTMGLTSALIFEEQRPEAAANLCFWATCIATALEALVAWPLAPRVATFFHEPGLAGMIRVMLLALVFTTLGNTHDTLLRRCLAFRRKMLPDVGQAAAKAAASVALALAGFGAWSLIWGQVLGAVAGCVLLWYITGWRPAWGNGWGLDRAVTRRQLHYAKHIYLLDGSSVLLSNLDTLTIGRMLSDVWLGFYTLAFRIPEVALLSVLNVITRVVFPAFSRLQGEPERMRTTLLDTVRYTALLTLPLAAGMALLAPQIVFGLYGRHWGPAVPVLRVLALYAGLRCLTHHFGDGYKAIGRPDVLTRTTLAWWLLLPPALVLGARWGGVVGVAWGEVGTRVAISSLHVYLVARFLQIGPRALARCLAPALEATAWMALGVGAALPLAAGLSPRLGLLVLVPLGGAIYAVALAWRHPHLLRAALRQFRQPGTPAVARAAGATLTPPPLAQAAPPAEPAAMKSMDAVDDEAWRRTA